MKVESKKETTHKLKSVDYEVLSNLKIKGLNHLIRVKKYQKARDTYLKAFVREAVDGVIHPGYPLNFVQTFRSSSVDPNFQNIPVRDKIIKKIIRSSIFPRPDHQIMAADFSGAEVKVAACYHQDPNMLRYLNDPVSDMHKDMAIQLYDLDSLDSSHSGEYVLRYNGKNCFVFPEFYGDYFGNCAINLLKNAKGIELKSGISTYEHLAKKGLLKLSKSGTILNDEAFVSHVKDVENDFWNNRFKVYGQWKKDWYRAYQKNGYVDMFTGFRCSGPMNKKEVINYPIQGAAFHCLLWAFIQIDKMLEREKMDTMLTGQIHDEVLGDVSPDERSYYIEQVEDIICNKLKEAWEWIIVPMEIDIEEAPVNGSWYETKEI